MKNLVTIVALSVDTRFATLYLVDGSTMNIPQGDARLPQIVADSKFFLSQNMQAVVDITPIVIQRTEFNDAEKGTKGVVRFFRVAKSFLKGLVNTESPEKVDEAMAHVSPLEIGVFPGKETTNQGTKEESDAATQAPAVDDAAPIAEKSPHDMTTDELATELQEFAQPVQDATNRQAAQPLTNDQKLDAAQSRMQQLVGNSVGTDRAEFHTPLNEETETIVAVHEKTGTIIPDAHKLARQLRSAQKLQDYTGFTRFVERLSAIIDQRGHSVEDLMKFIEKGDLPIADDGCIVIYKRLNSRGDHFVDVHSGNIKQKVGSYVFMKPGLVDPNRRQDCSNGLHVASLSYLNGFSGDVTVMAKVRPEDVFAVPEYAHNKMRVCGYHILANLPANLASLVNHGGSISSDTAGAVLLNAVLRGQHVAITQHVEVGGHKGTNVTYTEVEADSADMLPVKLGHAETLDLKESLEPAAPVAPEVKATDLVSPVSAPDKMLIIKVMSNRPDDLKDTQEGTKEKLSYSAQARALLDQLDKEVALAAREALVNELLALKKKARKSWGALGLPENTATTLSVALDVNTVSAPEPLEKQAKPAEPVGDSKKGKAKAVKIEKATRLLAQGLGNMEVAEATGLSKDQVYRLKKKLHN